MDDPLRAALSMNNSLRRSPQLVVVILTIILLSDLFVLARRAQPSLAGPRWSRTTGANASLANNDLKSSHDPGRLVRPVKQLHTACEALLPTVRANRRDELAVPCPLHRPLVIVRPSPVRDAGGFGV